MTINAVAPDDPVEAGTVNQLIDNVNGSPNRVYFTASGTWTVPSGCHRFKVTVVGGGGYGGDGASTGGVDSVFLPGGRGGEAPMISLIVAGADVGTSYGITVGAGGSYASPTGGSSVFGTLLTSTGGGVGGTGYIGGAARGSVGTPTFPSGAPSAIHINTLHGYDYLFNTLRGYGEGGSGMSHDGGPRGDGAPGLVLIEW